MTISRLCTSQAIYIVTSSTLEHCSLINQSIKIFNSDRKDPYRTKTTEETNYKQQQLKYKEENICKMKNISESSLMSLRDTLQMTNNRINTVNTTQIKRMSVIIQNSVKARQSELY